MSKIVEQNTLKRRGVGLRACDPERACPGFTLFAPFFEQNRTVDLINLQGELVHSWNCLTRHASWQFAGVLSRRSRRRCSCRVRPLACRSQRRPHGAPQRADLGPIRGGSRIALGRPGPAARPASRASMSRRCPRCWTARMRKRRRDCRSAGPARAAKPASCRCCARASRWQPRPSVARWRWALCAIQGSAAVAVALAIAWIDTRPWPG